MSVKNLNYACFILIASLWGGSYTAIKFMLQYAPPLLGASVRLVFAFLFLNLIFWATKKEVRTSFSIRWKIWLVGLFPLGIPFALLFCAERSISPGLAGILCATMPIWAFILSLIFLYRPEDFTAKKFLGLIIGITGVIIIFWPMVAFHGSREEIIGSLIALVMAVSYGLGGILNQYVLGGEKVSFQANIYHQLFSSSVFVVILFLIFEKFPPVTSLMQPTFLIASLYISLVSTALAWLMYYHLIREWGAIRASAAAYVAPAMAVLWDWLFFHNRPRLSELVGVMVILIGVILIQYSKKQSAIVKLSMAEN